MKIVVIIPTYNERENIGKLLDILVSEEFPKIKKHEMQILIVDDKSPDGTAEVVRKKMENYKNIHLLLGDKQGLGVAYARGMKYAMEKLDADFVLEFDADFQHKPQDIKRLVAEIDKGYDYIIGSRYIKGGSIPREWGFNRKFLSVVGNLVARVLLIMPAVHDVTTGFKLTRVKGFLDKLDLDHLYSRSFAYKVQLLFQIVNLGAKVKEVPIEFQHREKGESKIIKNELGETLRVIFLLQLRNPKIQRFSKFAIVGFIGYILNAIGLEIFYRFGFSPGIAAAIGAEVAIISNFTLNNVWTFKEAMITEPARILWKFLQFNLTSAGAILIQAVVVGGLAFLFGDAWRQLYLVIAVGFFVIPYNYTMYNIFIWRTWKLPFLKLPK